MISVMNNEFELDRKSDVAADLPFFDVQSSEKTRVSDDDTHMEVRIDNFNGNSVGGDDGGTNCETIGSEEIRVSSELDGELSESKMDLRISDVEVPDSSLSGEDDFSAARNAEPVKTDSSAEARVYSEVDSRGVDEAVMGDFLSEVKAEDLAASGSAAGSSTVEVTEVELLMAKTEEGTRVSSGETKEDVQLMQKPTALSFHELYSMFDEFAAAEEPEAFGAETAKILSYGFEPGDMVWGKVKSHPWWPGHIFTEAFATPSVRRTKREGHVLVAFFGDSSYGWFDPAELIHFEPHYFEKSQQTNSRTFMKAVEEAVDEVSRRRALGLACCCRNPFNFRLTNVQQYFSVDVYGYEPGGVYSMKQINKARDSFQPAETLSFVQKLALMPRSSDLNSIDWIKNVATCLTYRRAVFEEFDETYAQAFGVQPVRPSHESMGALEQLAKVPSRAPLSGPLVIAEALGERKSSTKPKVKDQLKKDKYVFKRRDEPNDPRARNISHGQASSLGPSGFKEGAAALAAGDYVLQKRAPGKQEGLGTYSVALTRGGRGQETVTMDKKLVVPKLSLVGARVNAGQVDPPVGFAVGFPMIQPPANSTPAIQGLEDGKPCLDKDIGNLPEMKGRMGSDATLGPTSSIVYESGALGNSESPAIVNGFDQNLQLQSEAMITLKHEQSMKLTSTVEGLEQTTPKLPTSVENYYGLDQVWEGGSIPPVSTDERLPGKILDTGIDSSKGKILKRPREDLSSEKSIMGEKKKKKKKKKELGQVASPDHLQKRLKIIKDGESMKKSAGKSIGIVLPLRENSQMDSQRKDDRVSSAFPPSNSVAMQPMVDVGNIEPPQLVDDLLGVALDPFHGIERNSPAIVRQVFLRFRSLVYQKSLVLASQIEAETSDIQEGKTPTSSGAAEMLSTEDVRVLTPKPPKHLLRPDDPTKAGKKRSPSGRQEEKSAKRLKKMNELKSMAAEKKASSQKIQEVQRERKEAGMTVPAKSMQPVYVKKLEPSVRVADPTMLVMKFPPRTTLPSVPELKARFARFGPLDHNATRVFWKSSTCRIVFKHKPHAQAAHNYAVRNNSLFGHVRVNYSLRGLEGPATEITESGKRRAEDTSNETPQFRIPGASDSLGGETRLTTPLQWPSQSSVQLKSCLKKPTADESGPTTGGTPRESQRVKFKLSGEESSRGEQVMVVSSSSNPNNNNGNNADGGQSSSLAMDFNSKNFHKVIPSLLPPLLPLPLPPRNLDFHENRGVVAHFPKALPHVQFGEVVEPTRNNNNMDISRQMLSLLMRCSDIVTDVKCSLGYVPYHPL